MAKTDSIDKLKCKIAILEDAKKRLLNKSDTFICVAIYSVQNIRKISFAPILMNMKQLQQD